MQMLDRTKIAALIPHAGTMCLIDRVTSWNKSEIVCETATHQDKSNPMRKDDRLGAVCGIEYAAQAMAIHGRLGEGDTKTKPKMGFLASIREVKLHTTRLDDIDEALTIRAEPLLGEEGRVIYHFKVSAGGNVLVEGRAAVVLQPTRLEQA